MTHPLLCRISPFQFYGGTQNPAGFIDVCNTVFEILRCTLSVALRGKKGEWERKGKSRSALEAFDFIRSFLLCLPRRHERNTRKHFIGFRFLNCRYVRGFPRDCFNCTVIQSLVVQCSITDRKFFVGRGFLETFVLSVFFLNFREIFLKKFDRRGRWPRGTIWNSRLETLIFKLEIWGSKTLYLKIVRTRCFLIYKGLKKKQ